MKIKTRLGYIATCFAVALPLLTPMAATAGKPIPYTACSLTSSDISTSPFANASVLDAPGGTSSIQFFFAVNYTFTSMQGNILESSLYTTSNILNYKAGNNAFALNLVELKNSLLGTGAVINLTSVNVTTRYYGTKNRIISNVLVNCPVSIP